MQKFLVTCCAFAIGFSASTSSFAVPATPGTEPRVEAIVNRPGTGGGRVRRYRSYSIEPGAAAGPAGSVAAPAAEPRVYSAPASPRRGSTPSYMRADSKARGRFGQ